MEKATFGAGCFWGVQASFDNVKGVTKTEVGYMGGTLENPTYEDVCSDQTGHTEVCQVEFDPSVIDYKDLLNVFWEIHDPTQMNRQGPDVGIQYRSVIFYHSDEQKKIAENSKEELDKSGKFSRQIATSIEPASTFWKAEEYHQKYLEKKGEVSCHVLPKERH